MYRLALRNKESRLESFLDSFKEVLTGMYRATYLYSVLQAFLR